MRDISIQEKGDGGEVVLLTSDIEMTDSLFNQVYIGLFGGNVKQTTREAETVDGGSPGQRFDYWGNTVFFRDNKNNQFNSLTERELSKNAINSSGRSRLEATIKKDLEFMREYAEIEASVILQGSDKTKITITLTELEGLSDRNIVFLWNGTKIEVISEGTI